LSTNLETIIIQIQKLYLPTIFAMLIFYIEKIVLDNK